MSMPSFASQEAQWELLYPFLQARVSHWVRTSNLPLWRRQREAVVEDIVQDTLLRTFIYTQRAERGEVRMIDSLEHVSAVIAYHCYVDSLRRDRRVLPLFPNCYEPVAQVGTWTCIDLSEQATNNVHQELTFMQAAQWIACFPDKQRTALLIDLANRMYFDPLCPTPLQQAFIAVGIRLQEYRRPLASAPVERARHAAHLSLAYKRIANLAYLQHYTIVA
jgi:DNA-directed RNA polymerase specialized sigma24 family protein